MRTILLATATAALLAGCGSGSISTPAGSSSSTSGTTTGTGLASAYKTVVWQDNFANDASGAPNPAYWAALTGNGTEYGNTGWGNNEAEYYLPSNATVSGGDLLLHGHADSTVLTQSCSSSYTNCLFSSARLTSLKTVDLSQPGYLEVDAELPTGTGSWPAIWLLPGQSPGAAFPPTAAALSAQPTWPAGGEIDMAEWMGTYFSGQDAMVQSTLHLPTPGTTSPYKDTYEYQQATLSSPIATSFHRYQLAWTAQQITFAVDDNVVMTCSKATMQCTPTLAGSPSFPATAIWPYGASYTQYYLLLNLAIGGNLGAPGQNNANVPSNYDQTMKVSDVRYMTP